MISGRGGNRVLIHRRLREFGPDPGVAHQNKLPRLEIARAGRAHCVAQQRSDLFFRNRPVRILADHAAAFHDRSEAGGIPVFNGMSQTVRLTEEGGGAETLEYMPAGERCPRHAAH